ncbi:MAG: DNA-binding transcriptional regulator [Planctomycetota bacterium]|jgi:LacI family transcriptional regulator
MSKSVADKTETPKVILQIETSRAYGRGLIRGIVKYAGIYGHWVFYREHGGQQKSWPLLRKWGARGIITRARGKKKTRELLASGLPVVYATKIDPGVGEQVPFKYCVVADNEKIGQMAADHLLERGFTNFAYCGFYLAGFEKFWPPRTRGMAFSKRVVKAGFDTCFYHPPGAGKVPPWEQEQLLLAKWLKLLTKPVGLMAANDDRAQQVVEACKVAGLRIPDEVAIISVDNDEMICDLSDPPLSSISLNTERAGYEAAGLLDKLMKGEKVPKRNITVEPVSVVCRQSTDILAIDDKDISAALRFIRENSKRRIRVNDVTEAVAMSRRGLERRFRKFLSRSIYDEIKRARIQQVAKMLVDTNLSISRVAYVLGYSSVANISRSFKQEKGISPQGYRKKYGKK